MAEVKCTDCQTTLHTSIGEFHKNYSGVYCEKCWPKHGKDFARATDLVAAFLTLIGETVPAATIARAVQVAPGYNTFQGRYEVPRWARDLSQTLMNGDPEGAERLIQKARQRPSTSSSSSGRSSGSGGMDPVTAFVIGAALF